jgi:hypothetical protein
VTKQKVKNKQYGALTQWFAQYETKIYTNKEFRMINYSKRGFKMQKKNNKILSSPALCRALTQFK